MGDIKARLKRVKELIDEQQWQRAYEITERICTEESNHVQARIFMGKVAMELDKPEKAIECFRIAVKEQPEFLPGWQGIVAHHSRFGNLPNRSEELLEGFKRCLDNLGTEEKFRPKQVELLKGYAEQLLLKGSSPEEIISILLKLEDFATGFTFKDARIFGRKSVIRVLLPVKYESDPNALPAEHLELLLKTFTNLLSEYDQSVQDEFYPQEHLNTLIKLGQMNEAEAVARTYYEKFETIFAAAVLFINALLKSLLQRNVDKTSEADWVFMDKLAAVENQHPLIRVGKAFQSYLDRNFSRCADLMGKAVFGQKSLAALPLVYKLPITAAIEKHAKKYLAISWICLGISENYEKAIGILKETKNKIADWEVYFFLGFALVEIGNITEAKKILEEAEIVLAEDKNSIIIIKGVQAYIALQNQDYPSAEHLSEVALRLAETNHLLHYIFFRSLWDSQRRDPRRCISHLKRTLELYPDFPDAIIYLAFWTWREEKDAELAQRHYERAYSIQPNNIRIIKAISDFYTLNRLDDKAIEVLKKALRTGSSVGITDVKWIRLRLALLCFRNQLWNECISYIRQAASEVSDTSSIKELLADSLTFRGNYFSAKGVFDEIIEQEKNGIPEYSWYRRACIKQKLKMDQEAEEDFRKLKDQSPTFRLMCLKSLAEIEIRKAGKAFENYLPIAGVESCQKAVDFASEAILSGDNSTLVWCLLGDACILMRSVKTGNVELIIENSIWSGEKSDDKVALNVRQSLYLATICYGVAIELKRTSARLWERLAMAYFFLALRVQNSDDEENYKKWMQRSVAAAKEMLKRSPYNPWTWNTAGIIAGSSGPLCSNSDAARLHTKSLGLFEFFKLNPTVTAETWSALGYLYFNAQRFLPAHIILKEAQAADPGLAEAWVGQAWCAESFDLRLEALDLFRHACGLKLHDNAVLRYAELVVWLLLDKTGAADTRLRTDIFSRLQSVSSALDFLSQYSQLNRESLKVLMLESVLLEWMGLKKSALEAAQKALVIAESSLVRFEGKALDVWNMAKMNAARLFCENEQHKEALELIETVESEPTFQSVILLAIVHFRLGNFEESENMLEISADLLPENDTAGREAVRLASVVTKIYHGKFSDSTAVIKNIISTGLWSLSSKLIASLLLSILDPEEFNAQMEQSSRTLGSDLASQEFERLFGLFGFIKTLQSDSESLRQLTSLVHLHPERTDFRCLLAHHARNLCDPETTTKIFEIASEMIEWRLKTKNGTPSRLFSQSLHEFLQKSKHPSSDRQNQIMHKLFPYITRSDEKWCES